MWNAHHLPESMEKVFKDQATSKLTALAYRAHLCKQSTCPPRSRRVSEAHQ